MATSDQVKALIASHFNGDNEHFSSVVKQIAAHAAKKNQKRLSSEILELLSNYQRQNDKDTPQKSAPPGAAPLLADAGELVVPMKPKTRLDELVLSDDVRNAIEMVVEEHKCVDKLAHYGLRPARRILLTGPPGTGKTSTACGLAHELGMPFYLVRLDTLITKFLGETSSKLRILFNSIHENTGVFLFDEIDALATERTHGDDVGEVRRIVNSLLQFLEEDTGESIIIAATNHPDMLDAALPRRFDATITYYNPIAQECKHLIARQLEVMIPEVLADNIPDRVAYLAEMMSHADIKKGVTAAMKKAVLCSEVKYVMLHVESELQRRRKNAQEVIH